MSYSPEGIKPSGQWAYILSSVYFPCIVFPFLLDFWIWFCLVFLRMSNDQTITGEEAVSMMRVFRSRSTYILAVAAYCRHGLAYCIHSLSRHQCAFFCS